MVCRYNLSSLCLWYDQRLEGSLDLQSERPASLCTLMVENIEAALRIRVGSSKMRYW